MNFEQEPRRERVAAGTLGALLGSLAGVACILVISRLNIVASISGLVMAVCALKGYEKLAGELSKKGAAISCALIVLMTFFAHYLDITFEVMEGLGMTFATAFTSIPKMLRLDILDGRVFWGNLALLYLFTLLGAIPTIRSSLASSVNAPYIPASPAQPGADGSDGAEQVPASAEFYPPDKALARPLLVGGFTVTIAFFACGMLMFLVGVGLDRISLMFAGIVAFFSAIFLYIAPVAALQDFSVLYARIDGVLWRVQLQQLNMADTYRFTNSRVSLTAVRWHKLSPDEQERAKASVLRAVQTLTGGQLMSGSVLSMAVLPLSELSVVKETKWAWKVSYLLNSGKRRKLTIHKSYPDFAPTPDREPSCAPVPFRWRGFVIALVCVLAVGLLGFAVDVTNDAHSRSYADDPPRHQDNSAASAAASDPYASGSAHADDGMVAITAENYQALFHLDEENGFTLVGTGYLPAPEEAFGEGAFVNAHVPYCAPVYSDDGRTLTGRAHGIQVSATMAPTGSDAREAVETAFEAFAASGADIYEDGVSETQFIEEYGVAVKQVFYFEENGTLPRLCLFYADAPVNGCCYQAQITYLLEQTDDDYPALLAELGEAYGLSLPELEPYSA